MRGPYPVVIWKARYSGAYEGGEWCGAIADTIPPRAVSHDGDAMNWWWEWAAHPAVAVGESPNDVLAALVEQSDGEGFPDGLPKEALFVERP